MSKEITVGPGIPNKHYWKEVWQSRELLYTLSWRDIKVKYKQTYVGAAWGIIRPLLTTLIFTLIFTKIAGLTNPSSAPYALMVFTGMTGWQYFSASLSEASNSLVSNSNLITKVYFPRMIVPLSALLTAMVDFSISLVLIACMMVYYKFMPGWQIVFFPLFVTMLILFTSGVCLFFTALNVKYRDFRFIIPFVIQFGLYVTPIAFSSKKIPVVWRFWYAFNPMVGIINGFRWSLLKDTLDIRDLVISMTGIVIFLLIGIFYFIKAEKSFADFI